MMYLARILSEDERDFARVRGSHDELRNAS